MTKINLLRAIKEVEEQIPNMTNMLLCKFYNQIKDKMVKREILKYGKQ